MTQPPQAQGSPHPWLLIGVVIPECKTWTHIFSSSSPNGQGAILTALGVLIQTNVHAWKQWRPKWNVAAVQPTAPLFSPLHNCSAHSAAPLFNTAHGQAILPYPPYPWYSNVAIIQPSSIHTACTLVLAMLLLVQATIGAGLPSETIGAGPPFRDHRAGLHRAGLPSETIGLALPSETIGQASLQRP